MATAYKNFRQYIKEAVTDTDTVKYEFRNDKNRLEKAIDKITKCVAILKERSWGTGTARKFADEFEKVTAALKELEAKKAEILDKVRVDLTDKYFTEDEKCYTRCIELSDVVITVSKDIQKSSFSYAKFMDDLYSLELPDNLLLQIKALEEKNTKIGKPYSTVNIKSIKVEEGIVNDVIAWAKRKFNKLLSVFDTKLEKLIKKHELQVRLKNRSYGSTLKPRLP